MNRHTMVTSIFGDEKWILNWQTSIHSEMNFSHMIDFFIAFTSCYAKFSITNHAVIGAINLHCGNRSAVAFDNAVGHCVASLSRLIVIAMFLASSLGFGRTALSSLLLLHYTTTRLYVGLMWQSKIAAYDGINCHGAVATNIFCF